MKTPQEIAAEEEQARAVEKQVKSIHAQKIHNALEKIVTTAQDKREITSAGGRIFVPESVVSYFRDHEVAKEYLKRFGWTAEGRGIYCAPNGETRGYYFTLSPAKPITQDPSTH